MLIGDRLRELREAKKLSQGDIEKRTGLLRCYISRVENGHTVPSLPTLEKLAAALAIPLWKIFYEGRESPRPVVPATSTKESASDRKFLVKLSRLWVRMKERDRKLFLHSAQTMSSRRHMRRASVADKNSSISLAPGQVKRSMALSVKSEVG